MDDRELEQRFERLQAGVDELLAIVREKSFFDEVEEQIPEKEVKGKRIRRKENEE